MVLCCCEKLMNWPGKCFKNMSRRKEEDGRRKTASSSSILVFFIVGKAAAVNDDTAGHFKSYWVCEESMMQC